MDLGNGIRTQKELKALFAKHGFESHNSGKKLIEGSASIAIYHKENGQICVLSEIVITETKYPVMFDAVVKNSQKFVTQVIQEEEKKEKEARRKEYLVLKKEFEEE